MAILFTLLILAGTASFFIPRGEETTVNPGLKEEDKAIQVPTLEDRDYAQDGQLDLSSTETIKASVQQKADESMMSLKINTNPVYQNGRVNWMIENSSKNKGLVQVDVFEGNNIIYKSPTLKANQFVQSDVVDLSSLGKGRHEVKAIFNVYDEQSKVKIGQSSVKVNLTIM